MNKVVLELPPMPYYITIGQTRYKPGEQHPNRRNTGLFDWLFVAQGTLAIGEEDKQWQIGQGQSLLLLPDRYHYATAPCREDTVFYWIHFVFEGKYHAASDSEHAQPIRHAWANPYLLKLPQYAAPRQFPRIERLLEEMHELAETNGADTYWKEQQQFMDLCRILEKDEQGATPPTSIMKLAERTEAYLRQHYQEDLTNEALADALHFHPNYIVRCMKEIYRCTPMDYLLKIRMEQAKLLLIKTEWPVSAVAEQVGFHYAPYFSSCFRRYAGMPPMAFRKQHAE